MYYVHLPWGIEFNEDLLAVVEDDFIEVGGDQGLDGLGGPVGGQVLAQQVLFQGTSEEGLDEFLITKRRILISCRI